MTLPHYITFKHDHVYVCSTVEPHYIFRVQHVYTEYWVVGYSIWLEFAGTLGGNRIMLGEDIHELTMGALTWYTARVQQDYLRYKKYKL